MKYLLLAVFLAATAIHLYASAKKNQHLRNLTKPFLLLSLLGFYVLAAGKVIPAVVLALFFSWLGDLLLIPDGIKWFTAGGIAFMVSHVFFAAAYSTETDFTALGIPLLFLPAVIFFALSVFTFHKLRPYLPKQLFYPMFLYLLINGAMNCFAVFRLAGRPCTGSLVTCIGAFLFFISDATLFFVRFKKDGKLQTHFWVMLTYLSGEFLIILGLL